MPSDAIAAMLGRQAGRGLSSVRRRRALWRAGSTSLGVLAVLSGFAFPPHLGAVPTARFSLEEQQILRMLPFGFAANSCSTGGSPPAGSLASLDCVNGPLRGRFSVFADLDSMSRAFQSALTKFGSGNAPPPCPGLTNSPATWYYTVNSGQTAGQIVCGTFERVPNIGWTRNRQKLLLDVRGGADLDSLFQWWGRFGNASQLPFVR